MASVGPASSTDTTARSGALMGALAYVLWGLFPIYWKLLDGVPAFEILAHRIVWSLFFVMALLLVAGGWRQALGHLRDPKRRRTMLLSTTLIATNWGIFIWAVGAGRITDASLGYYINPLLNVAIGHLLLGERLRPLQAVSVALAAFGVVWLTVSKGELPWVSLVLATTFCLYGLVRKRAPVSAVEGLVIETGLTMPLALLYLLLLDPPLGHLVGADMLTMVLLLGSGVVTAIPLLAFAGAARRLRFTTLGMLQYLAPTLQLGCAVLFYGEPFGRAETITFGFIWSAVALYLVDALRQERERRAAPVPPAMPRPAPTEP